MKIAITGSTGQIGRAITTHALLQGHQIVGIDVVAPGPEIPGLDVDKQVLQRNFRFLQADLKDPDVVMSALKGEECEAVIHLAALRTPGDGLFNTHNLNVIISWNVLRAAAALGITRVAQASSINAIGIFFNETVKLDYLPIDENHACRPDEPYSISKQICEIQADCIARKHPNMRISSIRPHMVVPTRVEAAHSSSKHLWAYTLESSCAEAFLSAVTTSTEVSEFKTGHEVFFIVERRLGPEGDVYEMLRNHKDWAKVKIREGVDLNQVGLFDCRKAERLLGWKSTE